MSVHRRVAARGCYDPRDKQRIYPKIVIRFDQETFDQIGFLAIRDGVSFGEQVRRLVEMGLETDKEAEGRR